MTQKATFAAGCFWGVESAFRAIPGVTATRVGYTGGHTDNPTYYDVCSDTTGHAEAVEVEFDPEQAPYEQLLDLFWRLHDPTQGHRQGPDVGSQYRSAVFFHSPEQEEQALASRPASRRSCPPGSRPRSSRPASSTRPRTITSSTSRSRAERAATQACEQRPRARCGTHRPVRRG